MSNPEHPMSPSDDRIDFLFGNIDANCRLEEDDDILDPESKRHLSKLGTLAGLNNMVKEIYDEKDCDADEDDKMQDVSLSPEGSVEKASDAVDYSNINELAKDESYMYEQLFREAMSAVPPGKQDSENDEDYDEDKTITETGDNVASKKAQQEALKTLQYSSKVLKSHCPSGDQIILSEQWPNKKRKRSEGQEITSPAKRPSNGKQGRKNDKENIPSP